MNRRLFLLAAAGLLVVGLGPAAAPAAAHTDGCLISSHITFVGVHAICTSNPETCLVGNVQAAHVDVNAVCFDPEPRPCLLKAAAAGHNIKVCRDRVQV